MASRVLALSVGTVGALVAYHDKPLITVEQSLYFGGVTLVNGTLLSFSPVYSFAHAMGGTLLAHTVLLGIGYSLGHMTKKIIKE